MRPLQILILLLFVYLPNVGFAQQQLTIDGPSQVEACDLVRLKVNLQEGESALWIVEPAELDYEPLGDRIIFSLACVKEARVTVIAASVVEGKVIFRQLRHRVRVVQGNIPPKEPLKPNEPSEPDDDGPGTPKDWSSATVWIKQHATVKADRETATAYASKLESIQGSLSRLPLDEGRKLVGSVRREVFGNRSSFEVDWNPFLMELDRRISKQPPRNSPEFASLIKAMVDGLKTHLPTTDLSRSNLSPSLRGGRAKTRGGSIHLPTSNPPPNSINDSIPFGSSETFGNSILVIHPNTCQAGLRTGSNCRPIFQAPVYR